MRLRLAVLAVIVAAFVAAPAASAASASPVLEHGPFAGGPPPAPIFEQPGSLVKSFKIELLPF
jgi:hypothetical protein